MKDLETALRMNAEKGKVKIANSWDEMANWIGANSIILKNTISEYNASCEMGYDELFAKDRKYLRTLKQAPFYAIKCAPILLDTIGVIKINERMEVLNKQNEPIPGLYAAGVVTSGWQSNIYCGALSAGAFGYAVNSGRIAGENSAQLGKTEYQY